MNSYQYAPLFKKNKKRFVIFPYYILVKKKKNRKYGLENNLIATKYHQNRLFHDMGYDSENWNNLKMKENAADKHKPQQLIQKNFFPNMKMSDV